MLPLTQPCEGVTPAPSLASGPSGQTGLPRDQEPGQGAQVLPGWVQRGRGQAPVTVHLKRPWVPTAGGLSGTTKGKRRKGHGGTISEDLGVHKALHPLSQTITLGLGDAHRPVAALLCCAHPVTSCGAPCTGQRPPRAPSVLSAFPHSPNSCGTSIRGRTPVQRGNEADAGTVLVLGEIRVWPAEKQAQAPRVSKARRALRSYHGRGRGATAALSTSGASPWVVGSTDSLMQHWGFHGTSPKPSLRMTDDRRATVRD